MPFSRYIASGLLCLLISVASLAQENTLFIGQVQIEDARSIINNQHSLQYKIIHKAPDVLHRHLVEWFPQLDSQSTSLIVRSARYPRAKKPVVSEKHRATTFLIDYAEPSVKQLADKIAITHRNTPSAYALEQFVHDYISDKNYANGFDIASQVARSQEGDCTEHAVLLTALLRMYGYPARVVTGVYISLDEPVSAYGHAWTEFYSNHRWNGLDATRINSNVNLQYLPLAVIEDETISYAIGLMNVLQTLAIERIIITN